MRLYVYNTEMAEPYEVVATVDGQSNEECESRARDALLETNEYGWAYTDFGLVETDSTRRIGATDD